MTMFCGMDPVTHLHHPAAAVQVPVQHGELVKVTRWRAQRATHSEAVSTSNWLVNFSMARLFSNQNFMSSAPKTGCRLFGYSVITAQTGYLGVFLDDRLSSMLVYMYMYLVYVRTICMICSGPPFSFLMKNLNLLQRDTSFKS